VDHGKTTLVDAMLRQSLTRLSKAAESSSDLIMDSNELERERGITIFSKNASVVWEGVKINIIDTPGHADFGGEVERVLSMADGCLLLVDAKEGPMPQTRFVLRSALRLGLKVIVVINKVDMPGIRVHDVHHRTLELFLELGADEKAADFPIIYASARDGKAGLEPELESMKDISPIFAIILREVPPPAVVSDGALQMRITSINGDPYLGRIGTGRVYRGVLRAGATVMHIDRSGRQRPFKLAAIMTYEGLERVHADAVVAGDIAAVAGIADVNIGESITDLLVPEPLPLLEITEPTVKMTFSVNDSPFAGREGTFSTSRQVRERLIRELETDVALRVQDTPDGTWIVSGRGEFHLAILIERMRREGYEFQVSRPQVITKETGGKTLVPWERLSVEVPEQYYGTVMQQMGKRHGEVLAMNMAGGTASIEFAVPTRGLFGYRPEFLTDTRGMGIMNAVFDGYRADEIEWREREQGSLVAFEGGVTALYGLVHVQDRGVLFVGPGVKVYKGQVVGMNSRSEDISINVCREKKQTNMRSKGDGVMDHFDIPREMGLEAALEYIGDDELVEVTPESVRIRKGILDENAARRKAKLGS
jgi:GTP-binding protein